MSLTDDIAAKEAEINRTSWKLDTLRAEVLELRKARKYCQHSFTPSMKFYEHEGGICVHCGVNEIAAACGNY